MPQLRQHQILKPLHRAGCYTCTAVVVARFLTPCAVLGAPSWRALGGSQHPALIAVRSGGQMLTSVLPIPGILVPGVGGTPPWEMQA